ncbi:LpqB family beta-propeller domain-containing protein [Streptomyces litchfieldiae]|uniref:LpqB family beta-propeller domain-containing protein n=1 Tax=Streptomyces litchfieldiae TaxID=3075543 RepID=A0ABU2MN44_9ACTN|nr:LpqB family beta-propeller domain-containing protein [Streptomyces sp. DSM 44938]MDT0343042.1 LpqB family beta-propeller domain-containing protein [Streptomyces sp. DSM 44938]
MATDRIRIRGARVRTVGALLAGALLLTGCASMPGGGPVQEVESSQRPEGESQVLVYGVPPEEGMTPLQIVRGFLEAITSDEARFETAKKYLTPDAAREWDPFSGITVLSGGPDGLTNPGGDPSLARLSGTRLATVDDARVYTAVDDPYSVSFRLAQVDGEWRIDSLEDGLVMGEADFRRIYRSVDTFYFAELGGEAGRVADGGEVLVSDPVYVRRRIDPVGDIVGALLDGPSDWYAPVVTSAFPEGVTLAEDRPVIGESGRLTVGLEGLPGDLPGDRCEQMAAQLLYTVTEVSSGDLSEARLVDGNGAQVCAVSRTEAESSAPGLLDGELNRAYFLDEEGRLVSLSATDPDSAPRPVGGPLGAAEAQLRGAAVSRDGETAAGVSADGSTLFVSSLSKADAQSATALTSDSPGADTGLSAPSWDGLGDLWVADRSAEGSRLLRLSGGEGTAREIPVTGLAPGARIEALRVASDGVRVAMLINENGHTTLQLGRIERVSAGEGEGETVTVNALREIAPQLEDATAVSWAGDSRLVVVGRPADGGQQLQYVITDGSPVNVATMVGFGDVTGVAAAEDEQRPLLADTGDSMARLQEGQWKFIPGAEQGSSPVYPG